jgi:release factor glutamine methyltransferase
MLLCYMETIKDVFIAYRECLYTAYEPKELESITLLTVSEVCDLSKSKIKAFPDLKLAKSEFEKTKQILTELKKGKPIQYIIGKTEFYGFPFFVDSSVLIPRQETEELVKWVIDSVNSKRLTVGNAQTMEGSILDIGTGSGCIAVSLKKNLPAVNVIAIDISLDALKTAKRNAQLNNVVIKFQEVDILNIKSEIEVSKLEVIVSNPPYVTEADKILMHDNVIEFEPHTALFVPENDPLIFYKAIAAFAKKNLAANGWLFFEINETYGAEVVKLLHHNKFNNIELRKDMNGRDRMIRASV